MSVDLILLPFDADIPHLSFSHTVLNCRQDYELFDVIEAVEKEKGRRVPDDFASYVSRDDKYEETHYGLTIETPYGLPVNEVEVERLLEITAPKRGINAAIWAYLAALPARTKVALFWH